MNPPVLTVRPNTGDFRLIGPVSCVDCEKPLNDEVSYMISRCGPGTFYHCTECGEARVAGDTATVNAGRPTNPRPPVPGCARCAAILEAEAESLSSSLKTQSSFYLQYEDQGRTSERIKTLRWAARLLRGEVDRR